MRHPFRPSEQVCRKRTICKLYSKRIPGRSGPFQNGIERLQQRSAPIEKIRFRSYTYESNAFYLFILLFLLPPSWLSCCEYHGEESISHTRRAMCGGYSRNLFCVIVCRPGLFLVLNISCLLRNSMDAGGDGRGSRCSPYRCYRTKGGSDGEGGGPPSPVPPPRSAIPQERGIPCDTSPSTPAVR